MSTFQTSEVDGHRHERFFPEGAIQAGTYRTSEVDGHAHFFVVSEDLAPGQSATITTSPPDGAEEGHQHTITVRGIEAEGSTTELEVDGNHDCPDGAGEECPEYRAARGGRIVEVKQTLRDGVSLGIIDGYIATWDEDTGGPYGVPDQFVRGAFAKSLAEHRARGNRPVRLKDSHGRTIGGFPIETVREDEVGLRAVGEINLGTQQGREVYALARQGVLSDLSVGFITRRERLEPGKRRLIEEADLVEGSIVDEPANRAARILEVKAVVPFQDLPLADRERDWDSAAAVARVRAFTGSDEAPSDSYRRGFLWYDSSAADQFGSYKLPIADVVGGRLVAVPRAVFAVAAILRGGRGGVDVPAGDRAGLISHVERYYRKLGDESPFNPEERMWVDAIEAKRMTVREVESALARGARFSKAAAKILASRMGPPDEVLAPVEEPVYDQEVLKRVLENLQEAKRSLRQD